MEDFFAGSERSEQGGGSTLAIFLGLYLLILAFFILLVSISTLEEIKTQAVRDSLTSTFASLLPPSASLEIFTSKEGRFLSGQEFQEQVTDIFATSVQAVKIEVVQPGREMLVRLPTDVLFNVGEASLRESMYPLLDRIVASLSSRPPGERFEMEFVMGAPFVTGRELAIIQTLEAERAGTFARAMISRGIPPDSIAIGLEPGDTKNLVIWFHLRGLEETRLRFDDPDAAVTAVPRRRGAAARPED